MAASSPLWLRRIVGWMEKSEDEIPEPEFIKGDLPEWVQNVIRELLATFFPVAKLNRQQPWTAAEVGALAGHKLAYCHALLEIPAVDRRVFKRLDRKAVSIAKKQVIACFDSTMEAIGKALVLASKRPYNDATSFFAAFSKALAMKPSDPAGSNFHRTNTKVYWLLLRGWKTVNLLRSVRELQQALCRHLEPHIVGDVKRIEKMCQRLELRLGRPGRPPKFQNRLLV